MGLKQLTITDILNVQDIKNQTVEIPEWGGQVTIQQMTAEARDQYEFSLLEKNGEGDYENTLCNARAKLVAACVLGPDGKRMFTTDQHIKALGSKSGRVLDRLFEACQKLNAITDGDIEEMAGN